MKRPSSADLSLKLASILLSVAMLFSGCAATGTSSNEVVATAIELADTYMALGDVSKAIDVYDRAISSSPDYRLFYNKAYCLAYSGSFLEAGQLCLEAFEAFPDKAEFLTAGAIYFEKAGKTDSSINCLETLLTLNENNLDTRKKLMDKALSFGMTDKAYEQALVLWERQVFTQEVASVLYDNDPARWQAVYNYFMY